MESANIRPALARATHLKPSQARKIMYPKINPKVSAFLKVHNLAHCSAEITSCLIFIQISSMKIYSNVTVYSDFLSTAILSQAHMFPANQLLRYTNSISVLFFVLNSIFVQQNNKTCFAPFFIFDIIAEEHK